MTEEKIIENFIKSRIELDEGWWYDFLLGAALAEFACGSYIVTTKKDEVDTIE